MKKWKKVKKRRKESKKTTSLICFESWSDHIQGERCKTWPERAVPGSAHYGSGGLCYPTVTAISKIKLSQSSAFEIKEYIFNKKVKEQEKKTEYKTYDTSSLIPGVTL